ncbi:MAG TPA: hypothetical protein VGE14_13100 [Marmoricola sp.]
MTSYITQAVAEQHVAELIHQAERSRVRRELRRARRAARAERQAQASIGTGRTNVRLRWA